MLSYPNIYLFRYQFFLQVKHDLLYGKLDCPFETVVQLSAFALQCKYFILYLIFIEFILFKVKKSWLGHQLFSAVALREKKTDGLLRLCLGQPNDRQKHQGPVVQSIVSLKSSLEVNSLSVLQPYNQLH